jgi:hypothetical protein
MDRHPCQVCARVSVTIDVHISQAAAVRAKDRLPKSDVDWVEGLIFMVSIYKTIPRQKFQKFCLTTRQMEEVLQRPREKSLAAKGIELLGVQPEIGIFNEILSSERRNAKATILRTFIALKVEKG